MWLGHCFDPLLLGALSVLCVIYTRMTSADLIKEMRRAGWQLDRVNGSHHIFKHPSRPGIVVVPHPKKDLGLGLVRAIRRQAGL